MILENLHHVKNEIERARKRRTEVPPDAPVTLVAVTKNHDVAAMREAIDGGVLHIGENRIQEAREKFGALERNVTWHLIGHLQKNKAKYAVRMFDLIHSVDSGELAEALDKEASKLPKCQDVLVQVNLAGEEQKSGVSRKDLQDLLWKVDGLEHLRLRGLMLIAPNVEQEEECRPLFREMHKIFQRVKDIPFQRANIEYLSMGMTHDYRVAVEEGANIVRVGTAIFGPRQY